MLLEKPIAEAEVEPIMAAWYQAGFDGRFGSKEGGRFHYISDPIVCRDGYGVVFNVDLGRANLQCMEHLLSQFDALHQKVGVVEVLLGRGSLSPVKVAQD